MNFKLIKILELCEFSAGICGVWQRVKQEATLLSKNHEVYVFSTNLIRGSQKKAQRKENVGAIKIKRFPVKFKISENAFFWNFEKEALKLKPDVIITHLYRHPHSIKALKIGKKLRCKVILVTHAPFVERGLRSRILEILIKIYDKFFSHINEYHKVITITRWEIPFLLKIGCRKEKLVYIPNGVREEFFIKPPLNKSGVLFLGRITPIKNLEILIEIAKELPEINFTVAGPIEDKDYFKKIFTNKPKNVRYIGPIYDLQKKIKLYASHELFLLPSKREGMPQVLLEAMATGTIPIVSSCKGNLDLIKDGHNGYVFDINKPEVGIAKIKKYLSLGKNEKKKVQTQAIKFASKFKWSILIRKLENVIK